MKQMKNTFPYKGVPPQPTKPHPISKGGISLQSKIKEHMTETEKITKLLKSFKEVNQTLKGSSIMEEMIIKYTTLLSKMKHK